MSSPVGSKRVGQDGRRGLARPRGSYDEGTAREYKPLEIISVKAHQRLAGKPKTWGDLMRSEGAGWWREQVFAMDWIGFAAWSDPDRDCSKINKGTSEGTWSLTAAGRAYLDKHS